MIVCNAFASTADNSKVDENLSLFVSPLHICLFFPQIFFQSLPPDQFSKGLTPLLKQMACHPTEAAMPSTVEQGTLPISLCFTYPWLNHQTLSENFLVFDCLQNAFEVLKILVLKCLESVEMFQSVWDICHSGKMIVKCATHY